jgi:hypothetical protein
MSKISEGLLPSRRAVLQMALVSAVGMAISGQALAEEARVPVAAAVSGPLQSAGALTFGPGNVLFVGDIKGARVHAFDLSDKDITSQTSVTLGNFHNFEGTNLVEGVDHKLAALLGTTSDNIVINDMVVHQPSQQIFLSVERGRGVDAQPAIVKLNRGQMEVLELDPIPHTMALIPNEPSNEASLEFNKQRVFAITDVKFYKGEVFVTGISNQRFASTLHRIAYPFLGPGSTTTVEIWHPVHGEYETRAPIIRQGVTLGFRAQEAFLSGSRTRKCCL